MFKEQSGLTLAELLVVAAIIMVLSAVTIPNWNRGGERLKVIRSAHQLSQDFRRAQELTLSSAECSKCNCSSVRSYGLNFSNSGRSYVLFGDCDDSGEYDGEWEKKEEIKLEKGVKIQQIFEVTGAGKSEVTSLNVVFSPPNPTVTIETSSIDPAEQAIVEIVSDNNKYCREVKTNKVGLVEINECE